uniref:Uncharacterized protein n=1 Tax=Coccolithus braarudii TaxID=221442 RepID=A0A7S0L2I0_9EUKA
MCARFRQHLHALRIAAKQQCGVFLEGSIYSQIARLHWAHDAGLISPQEFHSLSSIGRNMIARLPAPHVAILMEEYGKQAGYGALERSAHAVSRWAAASGLPASARFLSLELQLRCPCPADGCDVYVRHPDDTAVAKKTRDAIMSSSPSLHGSSWAASLAPPTEHAVEQLLQDLIASAVPLSLAATLDVRSSGKAVRDESPSPTTVVGVL